MDNILKDFRLNSKVPDAVIENYKNVVPLEIINLWQDYGFGLFMQGYLKSVNPEEYVDILHESSQRYTDSVVLFSTGMGDLVIWADGYVRLLNYRLGVLKTVMPNFLYFFKSLESEKFRVEYLKWQPYPEAVEIYGEVSYDECFGYTPLLGLGGAEKVENLKKVKLKEHILMITEFMGPVQ
ncbi:T6SS immunity protein Tdi1 domain-containing protein [Bacillus sp. REN3]|uniref:T6SS immunity protein Tdi1 domain-containing protein n=1 Tax=Bacillus sp. REN3 TaxID=2802440 RepID=UPI001AEEAEB2|nr:T6SS immunity protein Tdi1 domain-containing protein [Bacillus sp. REN3]